MREAALFAGAGGSLLAGKLLGWTPVVAVEWDAHCQRILKARQRDGMLPSFPIYDDVRTWPASDWRGRVDVITAGFPCQPFSRAGKQRGADDERNMWPATAQSIRDIEPRWVMLENAAELPTSGYFGVILRDLSTLGFVGQWAVLRASETGAPHHRARTWIVAAHPDRIRSKAGSRVSAEERQDLPDTYRGGGGGIRPDAAIKRPERTGAGSAQKPASSEGSRGGVRIHPDAECEQLRKQPRGRCGSRRQSAAQSREHGAHAGQCGGRPDPHSERLERQQQEGSAPRSTLGAHRAGQWWSTESTMGGMGDGLAPRLDLPGAPAPRGDRSMAASPRLHPDATPFVAERGTDHRQRLKALGNGWVPAQAAWAWRVLSARVLAEIR